MTIFYRLGSPGTTSIQPETPPTAEELYGPEEAQYSPPVVVTSPIRYDEPVRAKFIDSGSIIPVADFDIPPELSYTVRVGWEAIPANVFTLDASQLDSSKVLASQYSSFLNLLQFGLSRFSAPGPEGLFPPGSDTFSDDFSALFSDISDDVKSIRVRRGRDDNLNQFEAGTANITLDDQTSRYSPLNPDSDLSPFVVPGRPVTIEAVLNGQRYGVFRGFIRSIEHDPSKTEKQTVLQCQDLFLYLSRSKPEIVFQAPPITTGEAIGVVLDSIGWTDPSLRQLGFGDIIEEGFGPFTGDTTALQIIQDLLQSERGEFYQGRDGVVRFFYRQARAQRQTGIALDGAVAGAIPASDITNIRNRAIVSKTGEGSQKWEDEGSITNYGPSEITLDTKYINGPEQALGLAQWLVSQSKDPQPPIRAVDFLANDTYGRMFVALVLEIGDRIRVADSGVNLAEREFFIEGIEHSIDPGRHRTAFTLSKVPDQSPIIFGTSRNTGDEFASPTTDVAPYTTAETQPDIFAY
jgi:hypothetical protein